MSALAERMRIWYTVREMGIELTQLTGKRVCVAFSGGRDSVCLLHALLCAAEENRMTITALTCEHGIRGAASLTDLAFAEEFCAARGVPLRVFRADVPLLARESGTGLEEAGRNFRYDCFRRVLEEGQADIVATAHHLDDAAETVLFRLIRGTGLAGMRVFPVREGIAHPLLGVTRAQIDAYIEENHLPYVEDESNADERFARNLLRRQAMPVLEDVCAHAAEHLAAFAARAAEDDEYLCTLARASVHDRDGAVCVPIGLPAPLFARACLAAMARCGVERDYTSANIAEVGRLCSLQSGRRVLLPGGVYAVREGEEIAFVRGMRSECGEHAFGVGRFCMGRYAVMVGTEAVSGALVADMNAFPRDCVIRTRREGDMIAPYGGAGRKTLKKFFTDRKIPARIGRMLPLIASGSEVLAVFGTEIAERVKVTGDTARRCYLSLTPVSEEET